MKLYQLSLRFNDVETVISPSALQLILLHVISAADAKHEQNENPTHKETLTFFFIDVLSSDTTT
ncbi:hypothetical protein RCV52_14430, partial [Escherichia marmotae]|nr:hypothetical protein [Escherichia marmotae]